MKRRQGFTLLELLMVVIIIGILASIALPQYLRTAERSRGSEVLQNFAAIRSSQQRLRASTNAYTTNLTTAGPLDIDVPQLSPTGGPGTPNWRFATGATCAANCNLIATRVGTGATISMNVDTGATCTSNAATYGLTTGATC